MDFITGRKIATMPTMRKLPADGKTRVERGEEEEPFISLEETPIVLADLRAALPGLRKSLISRWPFINAVEMENRPITRRRNPYDPTQVIADAVYGIAIYIYTRPLRIFLDEVARGAGKKVGPELGNQVIAIMRYVQRWIKRMAYHPAKRSRALQKAKKRVRPPTNAEKCR
jgi:hypothetical protein